MDTKSYSNLKLSKNDTAINLLELNRAHKDIN